MSQPTPPVRSSSAGHPHYDHYYGREGTSKFSKVIYGLMAVAAVAIVLVFAFSRS